MASISEAIDPIVFKKGAFFSEHRIVNNIIRKGQTWLHFGHFFSLVSKRCLDKNHVYCSLCFGQRKILKYSCKTSETILKEHLRSKHHILFPRSGKKIKLMKNVFDKKKPDCKPGKSLMARLLVKWLATDILPFKTIEKSGFRNFCLATGLVDCLEDLPTEATLRIGALNDVYDEVKERVKTKLEVLDFGAISTDLWTDNIVRNPYLNLSITFIDSDWIKDTINLKTEILPHPHTSIIIRRALESVLDDYNISKTKVYAVTDSGSNVVKCIKDMDVPRNSCMGHNLHLLIQADGLYKINKLKQVLQKVKNIHRGILFHRCELYDILQEKQQKEIIDNIVRQEEENIVNLEDVESGFDPSKFKTLKIGAETRWTGYYEMTSSYIAGKDILVQLLDKLGKSELKLSTLENNIVLDVSQILAVFKNATIFLQGAGFPTLNYALLFIAECKKELQDLSPKTTLATELKQKILARYDARMARNKSMLYAGLLDPAVKETVPVKQYLQYLKMTDEKCLLNLIKTELGTDESECITIEKEDQCLLSRLDLSIRKYDSSCLNTSLFVKDEIKSYLSIKKDGGDPLEWWRINNKHFPRLAKLAKKYLAIPATSAMSESIFSRMGLIITDRKNRLSADKAEKLIYICCNIEK